MPEIGTKDGALPRASLSAGGRSGGVTQAESPAQRQQIKMARCMAWTRIKAPPPYPWNG